MTLMDTGETVVAAGGLLDQLRVAATVVDDDGRIALWSPGAAELFGYPAAEALRRDAVELLVAPEGRKAGADVFARVRAGASRRGTLPARRRDGSRLQVEFQAVHLEQAGGGACVLTLAVDAGTMAGVETDLALSEALIEQSAVGVAVFDTELRWVSVNPALERMNGVPLETLVGRRVREALPQLDVGAIEARMRRVLETGEPLLDQQTVGRTPADPGNEHAWSESYHRLDGPGGRPLGLAMSIIDISERHRAASDAARARERLAILAEAGVRIGTTLDLRRTAEELTRTAVPRLADLARVDVLATVANTASTPPAGPTAPGATAAPGGSAGPGATAAPGGSADPASAPPAATAAPGGSAGPGATAASGGSAEPASAPPAATAAPGGSTAPGATAPSGGSAGPGATAPSGGSAGPGATAPSGGSAGPGATAPSGGSAGPGATAASGGSAEPASAPPAATAAPGGSASPAATAAPGGSAPPAATPPPGAPGGPAASGAFTALDVRVAQSGGAVPFGVAAGGTVRYGPSHLVSRCVGQARPVLLPHLDAAAARGITDDEAGAGALLRAGVHSCLAAPLVARGEVLGALTLLRAGNPRPFDEQDRALAGELAARAAVCVDNARRYGRERDTALTLQRSLLPQEPPDQSGFDIAFRYRPAATATGIGGDWFDVLPLACGKIGLVVGDVMGKGVRAAAVMGQLRTATRALAHLELEPAALLGHLDGIAATLSGDSFATCVYAVCDPAGGRCEISSAGHLPPLLVSPDGEGRFVDTPAAAPLGVGGVPFATTELRLAEGALLALCTDGLVESRARPVDVGLTALLRLLERRSEPSSSLDEACDTALDTLCRTPEDDVALLLARRRPAGP